MVLQDNKYNINISYERIRFPQIPKLQKWGSRKVGTWISATTLRPNVDEDNSTNQNYLNEEPKPWMVSWLHVHHLILSLFINFSFTAKVLHNFVFGRRIVAEIRVPFFRNSALFSTIDSKFCKTITDEQNIHEKSEYSQANILYEKKP